MKVAGVLLLSVALGVASAFLVPRRDSAPIFGAPEVPGTASASPDRPLPNTSPAPPRVDPQGPGDLAKELAALRADPATFSPEEKMARAAELGAKVEAIEKAGNERELMAAVHGLAALGIEGYPRALEALEFLDNLHPPGERDRLLDACDGAVLRMAMWAIGDPEHAPEDSRELCAAILARHFDDHLDVAALILRALASEKDAEIRLILAATLPLALPVARTPLMATASFDVRENEEAALALARGIAAASWPQADRETTLTWLEASPDPATAEAASLAKIALHPPVAGVLIDRAGSTISGGLQKGDIVISIDGSPMADVEEVHRALSGAGNVRARVRRGEQEFDLGIAAGTGGGSLDGFFVQPR